MKKVVKALSGRKALYVVMVLALIGTVLDIVTSIRMNTRIDWAGCGAVWVALWAWAVSLENQEKKEKKETETV